MDLRIQKLIRTKRKTLALQIRDDGALVVRAPLKVSLRYIQEVIAKKSRWIKKKSSQAIERARLKPVKKFIEAEEFLYLGNFYKLYLSESKKKRLCFEDKFLLPKADIDKARELFIGWYKAQAKKIIGERVKLYSKQINASYRKIRITNASFRWGSCSQKGDLNFSWRIVMAPLKVLDYVVVHEMVHLLEKSHSKRFWERVSNYYPEYKMCRNWLKEKGFSLVI